jgi:alcohol dehydrogenase class IV
MIAETGFEIQTIPRATFGAGAVGKIGRRVKSLGFDNALLVTDEGLVKAGIVSRVQAALESGGVSSRVFAKVEPNPRAATVAEGAAVLRKLEGACVISIGGGSCIDAAKAIALLGPNEGTVRDFPFGCKPERPGATVICVPTTAGTGSETNMFGVVTDPELGRKVLVAHQSVLPALVVLDPELTVGLPQSVTAQSGMDALTHAIEAFTSSRSNPFSEGIALKAIAMVASYLPRVVDEGNDLEGRSQMLVAAHLAGISFSSAGLGICHAMGHPISARLDAAHGQTLAALLPHVMRFNADVCQRKYAEVAIALGAASLEASDEANAAHAIEAVSALSARVGTDKTVADLGVTLPLVPTLVEDALADLLMTTTPKYPSAEQVKELYEAAL